MSRLKVCLVFPRFKYTSGDPPLGLCYVASFLRENEDVGVSVLDTTFNRSMEHCRSFLNKSAPDIVGVYVDTLMFKDAVEIMNAAKKMGIFVVAGGPHASILPETLTNAADAVVVGEGELAFRDAVRSFREGNPLTGVVRSMSGHELDRLPFPATDLLDMDNYFKYWHYLDCVDMGLKGTTMVSSRGCPYQCTYCQPTLNRIFGSKLRCRSPLNVINEIKSLNKKYGVNAIFFHDDTFTIDRRWVSEFCRLIKEQTPYLLWGCNSRINTVDKEFLETMHSAGLRNIHFGIESGNQKTLDAVYKKCIRLEDVSEKLKAAKDIGIHTFGFFMLGAPEETVEDVERTIRFAASLDLDEASFSITNPLPETYLYEMVKSDRRYRISEDYSDFDYYRKGAIIDGGLDSNRLKRLQRSALFRFYAHPKRFRYMLRHLTSTAGVSKLYNKVRRFF